jgi:hypothetical protein
MRSSRDLKTLTTPTEEMPKPHDHCQKSYRIPASRSFRKIIDSANACSFDEGHPLFHIRQHVLTQVSAY